MKLRVLLADDHTMFRKALRMVLEMAPDIEVVGEAADGAGVIAGLGDGPPDVVCMDVNMPGLNGIDATRQLLVAHPDIKVIALSCHVEPQRVADMLNAGALGYVVKMCAGADLLPAIRMASQDEVFLSPELNIPDLAALPGCARGINASAK